MKELSQDQIWKMLEGQKNVLAPLAEKQAEELKRARCPNCGQGSCTPQLDVNRPFTAGSALPNFLMNCPNCSVTFDPYTKLVTSAPASIVESD